MLFCCNALFTAHGFEICIQAYFLFVAWIIRKPYKNDKSKITISSWILKFYDINFSTNDKFLDYV